jgi:hypothetical protein
MFLYRSTNELPFNLRRDNVWQNRITKFYQFLLIILVVLSLMGCAENPENRGSDGEKNDKVDPGFTVETINNNTSE